MGCRFYTHMLVVEYGVFCIYYMKAYMYCYVLQMCSLARAKYDNLAESPDELAFRRGDVLTVIDQVIT